MSRTSGRPRKLGRLLGVDMAWEVGALNQRPDLEFPEANKEFLQAMDEYSATNDHEKYLEFHKYQNSISEIFGETITRKTKGNNYICMLCVYQMHISPVFFLFLS